MICRAIRYAVPSEMQCNRNAIHIVLYCMYGFSLLHCMSDGTASHIARQIMLQYTYRLHVLRLCCTAGHYDVQCNMRCTAIEIQSNPVSLCEMQCTRDVQYTTMCSALCELKQQRFRAIKLGLSVYVHSMHTVQQMYGAATISRPLQIIGLFGRIQSLLCNRDAVQYDVQCNMRCTAIEIQSSPASLYEMQYTVRCSTP